MELAPLKIRVNGIFPGPIDTPMIRPDTKELVDQVMSSTPAARMGTPEEVARATLFLASADSSYVYGAEPDNPRYIREDHPLNVSRTFPDLRDLAEVEGLVNTFLWRYPEIATSVLRPVNVLGYYVHSAIGTYLKLDLVPTVAGFDPMMQFIHEEDVGEAIALDRKSTRLNSSHRT